MDLNQYKENPCKTSSLPYYKAMRFKMPENIKEMHCNHIPEMGETYFRLIHHLENLDEVIIPEGFELSIVNTNDAFACEELRLFVNSCYSNISLKSDQLIEMVNSPLFDPNLWIIIRNSKQEIVAAAISELDRDVPEGVLEWIQVHESYRGLGLGKAIILTSLHYFDEKVAFVTVSGECHNVHKPDLLYRACGFEGNDYWNISR